MKKVILSIVFLFVMLVSYAQEVQTVATTSTAMGYWPIGTVVMVQSTGNVYKLEIPSSSYTTMAFFLANATRYTYLGTLATLTPTLTYLIIRNDTLENKDANGLQVTNSFTATDTIFSPVINASTKVYSPIVDATTTLTLPGTTTITRTTGNGNSVTFNHSVAVTDTLRTPIALVNSVGLKTLTSKIYADSLATKRILVSDTLQGLVLYTAAGVKMRLQISPSGVIKAIAVP